MTIVNTPRWRRSMTTINHTLLPIIQLRRWPYLWEGKSLFIDVYEKYVKWKTAYFPTRYIVNVAIIYHCSSHSQIWLYLPNDAKLMTSIWWCASIHRLSVKYPALDWISTVEISIFFVVTRVVARARGFRAIRVWPKISRSVEWGNWSISAIIGVGGTSRSVSLNSLWIAAETISSRCSAGYGKRLNYRNRSVMN